MAKIGMATLMVGVVGICPEPRSSHSLQALYLLESIV